MNGNIKLKKKNNTINTNAKREANKTVSKIITHYRLRERVWVTKKSALLTTHNRRYFLMCVSFSTLSNKIIIIIGTKKISKNNKIKPNDATEQKH